MVYLHVQNAKKEGKEMKESGKEEEYYAAGDWENGMTWHGIAG